MPLHIANYSNPKIGCEKFVVQKPGFFDNTFVIFFVGWVERSGTQPIRSETQGIGWVSLRYTQPTNGIFYFGVLFQKPGF